MKRRISKTEYLGTAAFLTLLTPIWIVISVLRLSNPDLRNGQLVLILLLTVICAVLCAVNWYRYATYDKKHKSEEDRP